MSPRVLILTAGFGEGHNAAARALSAAFNTQYGPGTAELIDIFALAAPRLNEITRRGYLGLINRAPKLWSSVYRWLDRSPLSTSVMNSLGRERRLLAQLIAREKPTALCCTYPAYAFMLARLAREGRVSAPFFNIVTDSISINSLWWRAGAAGWFLPNEDSAAVMRSAPVDARRLHVLGFPVTSYFQQHATELELPDLGPGGAPRVLYIINSGTRHAADMARRLITSTSWELTCTVGRNEPLRQELLRLAEKRTPSAQILGWTDQIPRLLTTHHVVISKAGGATTQEALAARCPMIVNQIVPGQEEGNYELLRRHGVGALAETPDAVVSELQRAFADHGRIWRQWRAALEPLSHPRAASDIAARVLELTEECSEAVPVPLRGKAAEFNFTAR
jgi:processive 1,2-diacylglycerol beta-glucosyltransferase